MRKNLKKIIYGGLLAILFLPINVLAKGIILKADKTNLKIGDEVVITASVSEKIDSYALVATLKYDSNVFEKIAKNDFKVGNNASVNYNEDNNKFGIINQTGTIENNLFIVHLKVKTNASVGETNIALTNIASSNGSKKTNYPTTSLKVLVAKDAKGNEAIPSSSENVITPDIENDLTAFNNLPIIIFLGVIALGILIAIIVIYLKTHKNKKVFLSLLVLEIILFGILSFLLLTNFNKQDVNKDGIKDYEDAEEIIKYLIDIQGKEENDSKQNNSFRPNEDYDTNNDGKVDIDDAGHITEDVTQNSKVKLTAVGDDYYVAKGLVTIKFKAEITPKTAHITKVKIDGEYYEATINDDHYEVKVESPNKAGKWDLLISEVLLSNEKKVKTNLKITKEILKDKPYINNLNLDDTKGILTFDLIDLDKAFIKGTVNIYDDTDQKIISQNVNVTNKIMNIPTTLDKTYKIEVIGNYDLDSKQNDGNNNYDNKLMYNHNFVIGGDYDFSLNDIMITDEVKPGEIPVLSFKSTNSREANIISANITNDSKDAISSEVSKENTNKYEVLLTGADVTPGKHTVNLNSVSLDTLKSFYNKEDFKANTLTYTVLKEAPKAQNLNLVDNRESKQIETTFTLADPNEATDHLLIALIDSTYKLASKAEFTKEEITAVENREFKISLAYDNSTDGCYTVIVFADYTLSDKYKFNGINIGSADILSEKDIYIRDMYLVNNKNERIDNPYITKDNPNFAVAIEIVIGSDIKNYKAYGGISYVTINGINMPISTIKSPSDTYDAYLIKTMINVPKEAGVLELKANRIQLSNNAYYRIWSDYYAVKEKTLKVEVLKDKPQLANLRVNEDYNNAQVTFDFDIVLDNKAIPGDNSFKYGILTLDGQEGTPSTITKSGHNVVTFKDVKKNQNLDLVFKANFDLDSNSLDPDKNEAEEEIFKAKYGLYQDEAYQDMAITDGKASKKYYEKNEDITLDFGITGSYLDLEMTPARVIIDTKEYSLIKKDNGYEVTIPGFHSSGQKEITLTDLLFSNGKKISLTKAYNFKVEVLKDRMRIKDFSYTLTQDKINIEFVKKDPDHSLVDDAIVYVKDEKGKVLDTLDYKDKITFALKKNLLRYNIQVVASLDRDIDVTPNSANYYKNVLLLDEVISLDQNSIELKDIHDVKLFKKEIKDGNEEIISVNEVSESQLNKELRSYFVEITMENMKTIRASIASVVVKDKHLILVLNYQNVTSDNNKEQNLRIDFGEIKENGKATNVYHPDALKILLEKLAHNENVTLTQSYDLATIDLEGTSYVASYSGILNGNGYALKNLTKPLFGTLTGEVINLKLHDVTFDGSGHGALANKSENAKVSKVIVDSVTRTATANEPNGGLIGTAVNTSIEECGVINATINAGWLEQQNGLLIGSADKSTVRNSYAEGKIMGGYNYTSGFIGNCKSTTVINNFVKVSASGQSGPMAAFANAYGDKNSIYENNISIASGTTNTMIGSAKIMNNNYFYFDQEATSTDGITVINKNDLNDELFITKAQFKEDIWHIKNTSFDNLPILQIEKTNIFKDLDNADYDEEKENLYQNLIKLMPFYNSSKIIASAKNITDTNLINKSIKHIAPVDRDGNLVTYLTSDDVKKIVKIKVVFSDNTHVEYITKYDNTYDFVASYRIPSLGIDYTYKNYVIDADSQVVNNLTNYLAKLNYNSLDILTKNNDSRLYRDFYNEVTSQELKEFVLKFLANSNYTNTSNNDAINDYIEREVKKDQKIEKVLYTYNYLRRFYDVEIDNMKLYDFVLFNMEEFDNSLTPLKIAELFIGDGSGSNYNPGETYSKYAIVLAPYTKLANLVDFLEYMVTNFSDEANMANWVKRQFKGILVELPIEGHPEIQYTLWDHFSTPDKNYPNGVYGHYIPNFILPILTLPENAAYIISGPAQFIIGSQKTYMSNPFDAKQVADFKVKLNSYTERIQSYFTTAYAILEDKNLLNNTHIFILDKRNTKNLDGTGCYNTPLSTTDPFHKNFNEPLNLWAAAAGNNAAAWGYYIEMQVAGVLDSDLTTDGTLDIGHVTFKTLTHESAHNLDSRLFLRGYGRRFTSGGEDYADMLFMQSFEPFGLVMNLSINFDQEKLNAKNQQVGSNLTPERINTKDKIFDFYNKAFQTIYIIDYLEAQAFLQLPAEDKANLAIQISYPNETAKIVYKDSKGNIYPEFGEGKTYLEDEYARYAAQATTRFTKLNQLPDFDCNKLQTIDDLIDNKIMLYPGKEGVSSQGAGSYGGEGYNVAHWYQPHNNYGFTNSYSFKYLAYEMLGYAGYDKGFVEFASNIHFEKQKIYSSLATPVNDQGQIAYSEVNYKSDAMALKEISDNKYTDFDVYKKDRFNEVKENLDHLNKIINAKEYVQKFYDALKADVNDKDLTKSKNIRLEIYNKLKQYTNDFRTDEIYLQTWQQDTHNLNVQK